MKSYAVVFTYSFDDDCAVYLFDTENDALKFLRDSYENELQIQLEENNFYAIGEIAPDGYYAKITTYCHDGNRDVCEYHVGNVYC